MLSHKPPFTQTILISLFLFSISMGLLEAIVVVYLRELYYPEGFSFPLKIMAFRELSVEYLREISTIVMLVAVAIAAGKKFYERLSYFLFCFGIWDIFYYVWLRVLLGWPPSLLTWDILFLIPVIWVAPVITPVICSFTMILIALCILRKQQDALYISYGTANWFLMISGALIILVTFLWDYLSLIIHRGFLNRLMTLHTDIEFQQVIATYVPESYNWLLFAIGEIFILLSLIRFCFRKTGST